MNVEPLMTAFLVDLTASMAVEAISKIFRATKTGEPSRVDDAIAKTAAEFEVENLEQYLREWIKGEVFQTELAQWNTGNRTLDVRALAAGLEAVGLYYGEDTASTCQRIAIEFIRQLEISILHGPDGLEYHHRVVLSELAEVKEGIAELVRGSVPVSVSARTILTASDSGSYATGKLDVARQLLSAGKPTSAKEILETLRKEVPSGPLDVLRTARVLATLGAAEVELGNDALAGRYLYASAEIAPEDPKALIRRALALMIEGQLAEALDAARELLAADSENESALTLFGEVSARMGTTAEALVILGPMCSEHPSLRPIVGHLYVIAGDHRVGLTVLNDVEPSSLSPSVRLDIAQAELALVASSYGELVSVDDWVHPELIACKQRVEVLLSDTIAVGRSEGAVWLRDMLVIRGTLRSMAREYSTAITDFAEAASLGAGNPQAWMNYGMTLFQSGDPDAAVSAYRTALSKGGDAEQVNPALIMALDAAGARHEALELALSWSASSGALLAGLAVAASHATLGHFKEAESAVTEVRRQFPSESEPLLTLADIKMLQNDSVAAERFLEEAVALTSDRRGALIAKAKLADLLFRERRFAKAAVWYEQVVHDDTPGDISDRWLIALYMSGQEDRACTIATEQRQRHGKRLVPQKIEAAVLSRRGKVKECLTLYEDLHRAFADDRDVIVHFIQNLLRDEQNERVLDIIRRARDRGLSDPATSMVFGRVLAHLGHWDDALETALAGLRVAPHDADVALQYVALMSSAPDDLEILRPTRVAERCRVDVEIGLMTQTYTIIPGGWERRGADEIRGTEAPATALLGKSVGEAFSLVAGNRQEPATIKSIRSVYVEEYQDVIARFPLQFPENNELRRIPAEGGLEVIKAMLDAAASRHEEILADYRARRTTVGLASTLLGQSPIETWLGFLQSDDVRVFAADGSPEAVESGQEAIAASTGFVLEITSATTLGALGHLSALSRIGADIVVPQAVVDAFSDLIAQKELAATRSSTLLGRQGDNYTRLEMTRDDMARAIAFLRRVKSELKSFRVCGHASDIPSPFGPRLDEVLGLPALQSIAIASELGYTLVTDDLGLRQLARADHQLTGAWSLELLRFLAAKGAMESDELEDAIVRLVGFDVYFVPITGTTLARAFRRAAYEIDAIVDRLLGAIRMEDTTPWSAAAVLADGIREIWFDPVSSAARHSLLQRILSVLKEKGGTELVGVFSKHINVRFRLAPFQLDEIRAVAERFLKGPVNILGE